MNDAGDALSKFCRVGYSILQVLTAVLKVGVGRKSKAI